MTIIIKHNLSQNESEIITMFGFEWNKEEERQALIEISEARGEKRGEARGEARGIKIGKISAIRDLLASGLITLDALKASGRYSPDELAAFSKL